MTQVGINLTREAQTTVNGAYTFLEIPAGTCKVVVSRDGLTTFTERNIQVTMSSVVRVDVTLQVGLPPSWSKSVPATR
jgi:hypothetical protein